MTIDTTSFSRMETQVAKKVWLSPQIQILNINSAEGAEAGPLCDKFGSLSATHGHDKCDPSTK
jgi:hypothetical protein